MIEFGIKAPSETVFWQSWVDAGIVRQGDPEKNEPSYVFNDDYREIQLTAGVWDGVITKPTGEVDEEDNPVYETVPGWHCNARVYGSLEAEMTYGLDPYDENGVLKNVFDRTWAKEIFQLTWQDADPVSGFPAGYKNSAGVVYADMRDFSSPSNGWQ